jgi:hypothetical protein
MRTEDDLRAALSDLERHAPEAGPIMAAVPARAARRRRLRFRFGGAGLAVAAAAATAAALVAVQGPVPSPGRTGQRGHQVTTPEQATLTARDVLLAAAASAAATPDTGRYWETDLVSGSDWTAGPNAHPFAVEQRYTPSYTWAARSASQRSWTLPAVGYTEQPATPGALAAWRVDGSPTLPGAHGAQQAWWQVGGDVGGFGNADLTLAQFQALPSDASGLRAAISREITQQGIGAGTSAASQRMFEICAQLLKLDPITSAVRAAVFRVMATVPGVHSVGAVTDPLGRTGYGIEQRGQKPDELLVIAPGSGVLLADEELVSGGQRPAPSGAIPGPLTCPGGKILSAGRGRRLCLTKTEAYVLDQPGLALPTGTVESYDALVSQGWTDASPPLPPAAERFSIAAHRKG